MQRWINRALAWAPPVLAFVFLATVVVAQGAIRESLNSHGDFASTPVIAELMSDAPDGRIVLLGNYVWSEALWLLRGTMWLPHHFFVWQLIPFVLWLLTAALAGLVVRRVATGWAAVITVSMIICSGLGMRNALWSLDTHGPVAVHVALLAYGLVLAVQRPHWLRGARAYVAAVLLGLVTALGATDQLVVLCGLGPLVAAAGVLWLRRGDAAVMRLATVITGVALAGAAFLNHLADAASIIKGATVYTFVAADGVFTNLGLLPPAVGRLVAKSAYGAPMTATNALAMAAGLLAMLSTVVVLSVSVRLLKRALWPERFGLPAWEPATAGAPIASAESAGADSAAAESTGSAAEGSPAVGPTAVAAGPSNAWIAVVVFSAASLVANLLAWVFTNAPMDQYASRYLVSGWLAVCVLIPVLAVQLDLRWLAATTATIICLAATVDLIQTPGPAAGIGFPTDATAGAIRDFAKEQGVTRGYASYWDSMPITWHTRFGLKLYPLMGCPQPASPGQNCQFYLHTISSWYDPQPGRTMLLVDPALPFQPNVDPKYGEPIATKQFGNITAYVYEDDIAPQIGPRQQ